MPPLYPKMRERPEEFRINYDAPLAEGLVFAGLGGHGCVGSMVYPDSSLYGNHGRLINMDAATDWAWSPEIKRWWWKYDGIDDYVAVPKWITNTYTMVSACAWVSPDSVDPGNKGIVGCDWERGLGSRGWQLRRNASNLEFVAVPSPTTYATADTSLVAGIAQHVCGVADGSTITAYRNANPGSSRAYSATFPIPVYTFIGAAYSSATDGAPYTGRYWGGAIGDVLIHSRALLLPEIQALADPSNVDLRVGGVPLILPPRRRFWPVVSEQALPKMVPWHLFQQVGV